MSEFPKVALLVETARGYGRQFLRGVVSYARLHGPWSFHVTPGDFHQVPPRMRDWGGSGIIARITSPAVARAILRTGLPTIALDLSREQLDRGNPLSRCSEVVSDSAGAARMAAGHLLDRGHTRFAFVGIPNRVWSEQRESAFVQAIGERGHPVQVYPAPRRGADRTWEKELGILADWLSRLEFPAGVMACDDDRGRNVLEACRIAGIRVPEDLAVIGVDNDELLCELADPPLSSVALNAHGAGYAAAELLDRMMRRRTRRVQRLVAGAMHVTTRRSTDMIAIGDPDVAAALAWLHRHATSPIRVEELVQHLAVSRRKLEIRFQALLGRTLHDEVKRLRMDRARRFLAETELPVPRIAEAIGYRTTSHFIQVFRAETGQTPARFRRQLRLTADADCGS